MLYFATALVLSFVWFEALLFTAGLGGVLHGATEEIYSLPREVIWLLFPIISLFIAFTFKKWILRCRGWRMLLPAITLPWIGTFCVAMACGIAGYTRHPDPNGGFFGAFWYGVVFTVSGAWIVIPMGLLSQYTLLRVHRAVPAGRDS